jgi:glucokinase
VALRVLEQYVNYLAVGIRTLVVLYRPHIILLGGGISNAGNLLLKPLRAAVLRTTFAGDIIAPPPIHVSRLGNDAGIIGAAMLYKEPIV